MDWRKRLTDLQNMNGTQFEYFVAEVLRARGHQVRILGRSGDQGVDLLLKEADGKTIAVQCKHYSKPVGNKAIQEVFAGQRYYDADEAWVVAPSGYTIGGRQLARKLGVHLLGRESLLRWTEQLDEKHRVLRLNLKLDHESGKVRVAFRGNSKDHLENALQSAGGEGIDVDVPLATEPYTARAGEGDAEEDRSTSAEGGTTPPSQTQSAQQSEPAAMDEYGFLKTLDEIQGFPNDVRRLHYSFREVTSEEPNGFMSYAMTATVH
jgi:hypothetical protein